MLAHPNCKINIGLRVIRKRPDGYHDLDTLFYPVYGVHDDLEITKLSEVRCQMSDVTFEQDGIALDCASEDNLVLKCYRMMAAKYPQIGKVRITLNKHIPFGAGLGGGSSDAAHTALLLNELFHLGLSKQQMAADVRALGADCPFFIYNTPCVAQGIGDILTPVDIDLRGLRLVMVKPNVSVSTKEAYAGLQPTGIAQGDPSNWHTFVNDFEQTVFAVHPELAHIKLQLLQAGAVYAAMSGSGSTIYGLFENDAEGRSASGLRLFEKQFAPMILFNDTL